MQLLLWVQHGYAAWAMGQACAKEHKGEEEVCVFVHISVSVLVVVVQHGYVACLIEDACGEEQELEEEVCVCMLARACV